MTIKVEQIKTRKRPEGSFMPVAYDKDFELAPEGSIALAEFLRRKNLSLYSIDVDKKLAAFVEIPDNVDLTDAPFYYQSQYEHARSVYLMPFETFFMHNLDSAETGKTVLIYSVGRCGSTLLSKIFRNLPETASISEPDIYNQIHRLRMKDAIDGNQARKLIGSATRFLWRSVDPGAAGRLVIKLKSEVIKIHRDISTALPDAKVLFIYRNAEDVIQSYDRILGYPYTKNRWLFRLPVLSRFYKARKKSTYRGWNNFFDQYTVFIKNGSPQDIVDELRRCGIFLLEWLSKINAYLELRKYKSDTVALQYETLIASPREMTRHILNFCGYSVDEIDDACKAFDTDAHAMTHLARNPTPRYKLNRKDRIEIRRAIRRHTGFNGPDMVLPGTLDINSRPTVTVRRHPSHNNRHGRRENR